MVSFSCMRQYCVPSMSWPARSGKPVGRSGTRRRSMYSRSASAVSSTGASSSRSTHSIHRKPASEARKSATSTGYMRAQSALATSR